MTEVELKGILYSVIIYIKVHLTDKALRLEVSVYLFWSLYIEDRGCGGSSPDSGKFAPREYLQHR